MSASSVPMPSSSSETCNPPQLTVLNRMAAIPIIQYCIQQVSTTLEANRYTSASYSTAKGLSASAYKYAEPLHVRLAPLIVSADGYANKAVDVVQNRYPYPFEAQPEDVATFMRESRQNAVDFVTERGQNAMSAVYGIDQRFTPIVDYLENTAVKNLNTPSAPADTQHQYQRVYVLSKNVTGQLYDYSNQTVLVQRASQTTADIGALAASANEHIHALSDRLLLELQHLQSSLAATGASMQSSTTAASHELSDTIRTLHSIITTPDITLNEKVSRVGAEVQWRVRPLLDRILALVSSARPQPAASDSGNNDNGNGHIQ